MATAKKANQAKKAKKAKKASPARRAAGKSAIATKVDSMLRLAQVALTQTMEAVALLRDAQADPVVKSNLNAKLAALQSSVETLKTEVGKGSGEGVKSIGN